MRKLIARLWKDQVGSTQSTEMALVTSVTIGALFMGMAEFSATVNREFKDSAAQAGLLTADEVIKSKEAADRKQEEDEEKGRKKKVRRFRRAEDRK